MKIVSGGLTFGGGGGGGGCGGDSGDGGGGGGGGWDIMFLICHVT